MKFKKIMHVTITIRNHKNQKTQFSAGSRFYEGPIAEKSPIDNLKVHAHAPI
jgi:hypothetical protein